MGWILSADLGGGRKILGTNLEAQSRVPGSVARVVEDAKGIYSEMASGYVWMLMDWRLIGTLYIVCELIDDIPGFAILTKCATSVFQAFDCGKSVPMIHPH